jgi:hypothetical protein
MQKREGQERKARERQERNSKQDRINLKAINAILRSLSDLSSYHLLLIRAIGKCCDESPQQGQHKQGGRKERQERGAGERGKRDVEERGKRKRCMRDRGARMRGKREMQERGKKMRQ